MVSVVLMPNDSCLFTFFSRTSHHWPVLREVFVQVRIAVQYRVLLESAYDAYYRLSDPGGQIQSYVFDVVRSTVPRMELDEAFASKQDIADAALTQLKDVMQDYVSDAQYLCPADYLQFHIWRKSRSFFCFRDMKSWIHSWRILLLIAKSRRAWTKLMPVVV